MSAGALRLGSSSGVARNNIQGRSPVSVVSADSMHYVFLGKRGMAGTSEEDPVLEEGDAGVAGGVAEEAEADAAEEADEEEVDHGGDIAAAEGGVGGAGLGGGAGAGIVGGAAAIPAGGEGAAMWAMGIAIGDVGGNRLAALKQRESELVVERRALLRDCKNEERKRRRLLVKARGLSHDDLHLLVGQMAAAKAKAAPKPKPSKSGRCGR